MHPSLLKRQITSMSPDSLSVQYNPGATGAVSTVATLVDVSRYGEAEMNSSQPLRGLRGLTSFRVIRHALAVRSQSIRRNSLRDGALRGMALIGLLGAQIANADINLYYPNSTTLYSDCYAKRDAGFFSFNSCTALGYEQSG